MQWIVSVIGLVALLLLVFGTRQRPTASYRDVLLEDELISHIGSLAARGLGKGRGRIVMPPHMQRSLHRCIGYLNRWEERLPCAQWFTDNGRFLQEMTAAAQGEIKGVGKLPKDADGQIRVMRFARELVGHGNADVKGDLLVRAVTAWQENAPFTENEITALPVALRVTLLSLLEEMLTKCDEEQRAYNAAPSFASRLFSEHPSRAMRLFERYKRSTTFLEHLLSLLRASEEPAAIAWLDEQLAGLQMQSAQIAQVEHDRQTEHRLWVGNAITSLRVLSRLPWERLTEEMSLLNAALLQDEVYPTMDAESRAYYRQVAVRIGRRFGMPDLSVCRAALALCEGQGEDELAAHVGYYLLDDGRQRLYEQLRAPRGKAGWTLFVSRHACGLYRLLNWALFALLLLLAWALALSPWIWLFFACAFLQPLQALCARVVRRTVPPRLVPRVRVDALAENQRTLVVCPTLLTDREQALSMIKHLSVLHQANPDPNLHFMLLGDLRDSMTGTLADDDEIVQTAASAVRALCDSTGHVFYYLQRGRVPSPQDHVFMNRERKRGGLESLMRILDGLTVEDAFLYSSCPREALQGRYRYLITLDSDTILPPGSALRMVGAMLHPLQQRREYHGRMRGVSILQPRMEVAAHTVSTWLSLLLGGRGGTDPYNALASDVMHDFLGRGSFVGKGIIDPHGFLEAMEGKIIPRAILSHDLLEGELAGCAVASDITLYDGQPATLRAFWMRLHRWTRGDWQLLPYVFPLVPAPGRAPRNALDSVGKHKVWANLLRSVQPAFRVATALYAVGSGRPWLLGFTLVLAELPTLLPPTGEALLSLLLRLLTLPGMALMQLDAIGRTLYRVLISRRHLQQWTTAAQLNAQTRQPGMLIYYLQWGAGAAAALCSLAPGALLWAGAALGGVWALFPFTLPLWEKAYDCPQPVTDYMREELTRIARSTFSYFETVVSDRDHQLPPDNLQIDPAKGLSHRTSPTNIGLYLTGLICAQRLSFLTADEMAERMLLTVETMEELPKWEGHLYNWYDTRTLAPMQPLFVSSVDSGNLAVCLLTCAQGVRTLLEELDARYHTLCARLDALAYAMRFDRLYDESAELFYIGVHPKQPAQSLSHYDLLASEARLLSFVAIILRQAPVKHWYRLGRGMTALARGRALVSYSGTMFEYMLPQLFLPTVKGTLLQRACADALREQRRFQLAGAYGVSESGYYAFDPNLYYQYKAFGVPTLALDPTRNCRVIAPYASMLTLFLGSKRAFRNLQRMQTLGWEGALGLFEAADFQKERIGGDQSYRVIRSHMSHHQGMILLSITNLLTRQGVAKLFYQLPRAQAFALLMEEKAPRRAAVIRHPLKRTETEKQLSPLKAHRPAYPLVFPIDAHLLHGANTTWLVDAQGGGYLCRSGVMLTRFRESCRFPSGLRIYLRDSQTGAFWQATDPMLPGTTTFETAQAVFERKHQHVESRLRMFVNPLDGAAVCQLSLQNLSATERLLEVCSYGEISLAPQRDDCAHPSFQNLFVETKRAGQYGVMAVRRPRKAGEEQRVLLHTMGTDAAPLSCQVQTDRMRFLGRGNTIRHPQALQLPISAMADAVGAVIEPCVSVRAQFMLPARGKAEFVFATLLAGEQDTPSAFCERYAHPDATERMFELAQTQALVTARYLNLDAPAQNAIGRLCGSLVYTDQPHQHLGDGMNTLPLRELWGLSISGDLPILLLRVESERELSLVRLLLKAHSYYRLCGLWMDLVIVSDQATGYAHPLRDLISDLLQTSHSRDLIGKEGGVHLFERQSLSEEMMGLLQSVARIRLSAGGGSLMDQLKTMLFSVKPLENRAPRQSWTEQSFKRETLLFDNGYGGFSEADGNYVIHLPPFRLTPAPWCNVLASQSFGTLASESGLTFSYAGNSHDGRLTRWPNDSVTPYGDESFFLKEVENNLLWSLTRWPLSHGVPYQVTHAPGLTVYESHAYGLYQRLTCFTDSEKPLGLRVTFLRNDDDCERTLQFFHSVVFSLSTSPTGAQLTETDREEGRVFAQNPGYPGVACLCMLDPEPTLTTTMSGGAYQGLYGKAPYALASAVTPPCDAGSVGMVSLSFTLKPRQTLQITTALGFADTREALSQALDTVRADGASLRLHLTKTYWEQTLSALRFDLPDPALSLLLGRWLPYQVRTARLFARAGFYQAGGAYGFRDQLQDMLALVYTQPEDVRAHLLRCAEHQFEEGDVQHWWHEPRRGVRTRISDDLLFLPFVTAIYVQVTGDTSVLHEALPYLKDAPLREDEHERFSEPAVSEIAETLLEHCLRAINHVQTGAHGLPLMGGGDWNDGMNAVGGQNGESVWLGMFYCEVVRRFIPLCPAEVGDDLSLRRLKMLQMLDVHAWDGGWYLRAWYDDGSPMGSVKSSECRIDALPQSWAVLCGVSRERCALAMDNMWRTLYEPDIGILKLFAPPFAGLETPGYIAGYLPGIRENGGQYTHAVPWAIAALHQLGRDDLAWRLTLSALPVNHALTRQAASRYRVEPYVMAADIYANPAQRGRGGWTWYTGSASWMIVTILEQLFGFQKVGNTLRLRPSVPESWDGLTITYRYGTATYHLHASKDCPFPVADGERLAEGRLTLLDDGRIHEATFPIRSLVKLEST